MSKPAKTNARLTPPKWVENLLYWFSNNNRVEFLAGDLNELYQQIEDLLTQSI